MWKMCKIRKHQRAAYQQPVPVEGGSSDSSSIHEAGYHDTRNSTLCLKQNTKIVHRCKDAHSPHIQQASMSIFNSPRRTCAGAR